MYQGVDAIYYLNTWKDTSTQNFKQNVYVVTFALKPVLVLIVTEQILTYYVNNYNAILTYYVNNYNAIIVLECCSSYIEVISVDYYS